MSAERDLPAASFSLLVTQLATQAMMQLGLVPNPFGGAAPVALPRARLTLDLLGVLHEKTAGRLSPDEDRLLAGVLADLEARYREKAAE